MSKAPFFGADSHSHRGGREQRQEETELAHDAQKYRARLRVVTVGVHVLSPVPELCVRPILIQAIFRPEILGPLFGAHESCRAACARLPAASARLYEMFSFAIAI